jgi:hypothetical protein
MKITKYLDFISERINRDDIKIKTGLTDEEYKKTSETLKSIAEAPVATYLYGMELDLIVKEGRFKSLNEIPTGTECLC